MIKRMHPDYPDEELDELSTMLVTYGQLIELAERLYRMTHVVKEDDDIIHHIWDAQTKLNRVIRESQVVDMDDYTMKGHEEEW